MQSDSSFDIHQLIRQIADGDEFAFRLLFDHYKERFYVVALKMAHSENRAEEIVQETFVSIWTKRELIAVAIKPEAYLYTILQNHVYAHFRKVVQEQRLKLKLAGRSEECEEVIETAMIEKERKSTLENVISLLPPQQRRVYLLAKRDGMSRNEIAKRLNISPNTVRNHLSAAIESLHDWFRINKSALGWIIIVFFM